MGEEKRDGVSQKATHSKENGIRSLEDVDNIEKKSTKRKFSVDIGEGSAQSSKYEDKESNQEVNFEDVNLLGTIENENDSSDDDDDPDFEVELNIDSEDEQDISNDESDELSFEDDSENEKKSGIEDEDDLNGASLKHNTVASSSVSSDKEFGKLSEKFFKMTSIRENGKRSESRSRERQEMDAGDEEDSNNQKSNSKKKSKRRKKKKKMENIIAGKFVRPDPESVLVGQTEDEKSEEENTEHQDTTKIKISVKPLEDSFKEETIVRALENDDEVMPRKIVLEEKATYDEYENDTSDEEDIRNTVGNIPMNWYDDYSHLGYDWDGKKIIKPPRGDELDNFLRKMEDPNFWRTVKDPQTGQDVILCDADAELIGRLQNHKIPDTDFDEYAPWIEWFSSEVMQTPLRKFPEHKRSFIPSKDEARQVGRIVHAIKMGWIKPKQEKPKESQFYMLWESDDKAEHMRRVLNHIPAPKRHLPNHAESYNPPSEYLLDKLELKQWKKLDKTPWKRKVHFIPTKHSSLREVPAYENYIKERFNRCLDLYMCPRAMKMRLLIEPEDLVPQLPSPKDLQPFPTTLALIYKGHTDMVRCITVEPKGQYMASGSDDLTVKIWEVATGRCIRTIPAGGTVRSVSWCPNTALSLLAVAADRKLLIINPEVGDNLVVKKTDALLEEAPEQDVLISERVKGAVQWEQIQAGGVEWKKGIRIVINHFKEIRQVTWHGRGDYFATVMPEALNRSVIIHQISKRRSQIPFNRSKGLVQCVLFHPIRPIFFVATQKNVRVYDLVKQEIVKKLMSNSKWISSMAIHSGGDNILVGTYDRKILWFDLDLSTKPYQTLRLHGYAVRGVAFHRRYPLFASGSDDNSVIVCHGMVYNDLLQNPLIVPVKRMSYHEQVNDFSVFEVLFHPSQPWLFSSGADGTVRLYT